MPLDPDAEAARAELHRAIMAAFSSDQALPRKRRDVEAEEFGGGQNLTNAARAASIRMPKSTDGTLPVL